MFYLTTHSTHFIDGYMASDMVKDHSDSHMGCSYRLAAKVLLYAHHTDMIIHTMAFVTPVVAHWLEREIAQWVVKLGDTKVSL